MDCESSVRLCERAMYLDESCIALYESAFPREEREPVSRLRTLIAEGKLLYHRTLNEDGELLCFTFVSLADRFSFLAYMATNPHKRSSGIGTTHLSRLVEMLKNEYPTHIGLFLEIEATSPSAERLTEEQLRTRVRRRTFYERLGARLMCADGIYLTPSLSEPGIEWEGELMAIEFRRMLCQGELSSVIRTIYQQFYCLSPLNPMVLKVLAHFDGCSGSCNRPSKYGRFGLLWRRWRGARRRLLLRMRLRAMKIRGRG